jgi:glycosyltransferase involved in cell wall biosynthesis
MNNSTLVSIIIPAYNPEFFERALNSAIGQTWNNLEIIICDDSRDDTIRVVSEKYIQTTTFPVKYFKNHTRLGEVKNVLRCVNEAQGNYIKFLYDDDIIYPECVSRLVAALDSHADNRLAACRRARIDENEQLLADIHATAYPFESDVILNGRDAIAFFADHTLNFIGEPSSVLCYREDLLSLGEGLFELKGEHLPFLVDITAYLNLLSTGNLAFISEPLASFRVSANQSSQLTTEKRYQEMANRTYTLVPKLIRELGWYKGDKEQNQLVHIAPITDPQNFQQYNILQGILRSAHHSNKDFQSHQIHQWLSERKLESWQRVLVEAHQAERKISQTLLVVIFANNPDIADIKKTLESITSCETYGINITPFILSPDSLDDSIQVPFITAPVEQNVATVNALLQSQPGDWIICLDSGEELLANGMLMFDLALDATQQCDAIYGDEFYKFGDIITGTAFRPDFNLDLLLSHPNEMARHWIFRNKTVIELGGFNTHYRQSWQFSFIVKLIETKGIKFAGHLSEPLVLGKPLSKSPQPEEIIILGDHLLNRGYANAQIDVSDNRLYAIQYGHNDKPLVSIIIPTKDQLSVLIPCVTTLLEKTTYLNYELLIVDNNSETPEALQWLDGISSIDPSRIRVLRYPHPFNYSAINNMAASNARGEYLVLLNNDTAILDGNWLDKLLNHGLRPEVGITGAKLLFPAGDVQHAGVVMGLHGPADHPFINSDNSSAGYMSRLLLDQNYLAVTAACLLIRKSVYMQVEGLDEDQFKVSYNDVDLCLKVRAAGYLTVWTPHAVVMHVGSVSQHSVDKTVAEKKYIRFTSEQEAMYKKWLPLIANDPSYNPNLTLTGPGFQFATDSHNSWQPLHWKPLPRVMAFPLGQHPASLQRLAWPLTQMKEAALVDGLNSFRACDYPEIARYEPDALILQHQISPFVAEWLQRQRKVTGVFTVFDLEDFLPAMPVNHPAHDKLPKEILKSLRSTINQVDRLVVASETMAESCAGFHDDIRVVPTLLCSNQWSNLTILNNPQEKMRIGWFGDATNNTDLEIIHKLIGQFADRVDWVFYGYCPPSLRPLIAEFHAAVRPEFYPQKLASLNLDLALVPMADTDWNRNMSYVRLLEFGVCGVPVICSDIISLRNYLQVTRVNNRAKSWKEAIEMHIEARSETQKMGLHLQKQVLERGFLAGEDLSANALNWLPSWS